MPTIDFVVTYDDPETEPGKYSVATIPVDVGVLLARHRAKNFARRALTLGIVIDGPLKDGTVRMVPASAIRTVDVKHPLLTPDLVKRILKP